MMIETRSSSTKIKIKNSSALSSLTIVWNGNSEVLFSFLNRHWFVFSRNLVRNAYFRNEKSIVLFPFEKSYWKGKATQSWIWFQVRRRRRKASPAAVITFSTLIPLSVSAQERFSYRLTSTILFFTVSVLFYFQLTCRTSIEMEMTILSSIQWLVLGFTSSLYEKNGLEGILN